MRSGGRVVEGARLESEYTAKPYRGFESLPLRQISTLGAAQLDAGVPFVIDVIFPIAAFAAVHLREAFDGLDALDVFRLLVPKLALDPEAQRGVVGDRKQMAAEAPG